MMEVVWKEFSEIFRLASEQFIRKISTQEILKN